MNNYCGNCKKNTDFIGPIVCMECLIIGLNGGLMHSKFEKKEKSNADDRFRDQNQG